MRTIRPGRAARRLGLLLAAALSACTGFMGFDGLRLVPARGKLESEPISGGSTSVSNGHRLVGALVLPPGGAVPARSAHHSLYGSAVAEPR